MAARHYVLLFVLIALAAVFHVTTPDGTRAVPSSTPADMPRSAIDALRDERYLRSSLIIRETLASRTDTTPAELLFAARAEAGWGDWARVTELLEERPWLDTLDGGHGWQLLGRARAAESAWLRADSAYSRYLALHQDTGSVDAAITRLRHAVVLDSAGDFVGALAAYDTAAVMLPELQPWIAVFAVQTAARAGDTARVNTYLAEIPADARRDWAWRAAVDVRVAAGDTAGAIEAAAAAARTLSGGRAATAWLLAANMNDARGERARAREQLRAALAASPNATNVARALTEVGGLNADDRRAIGRAWLRAGNIDRAAEHIGAYLSGNNGTEAERQQLRLDLARGFFRAGRYDTAEEQLLQLANGPAPAVAAEALYDAGRAQYRLEREADARATLQRVAERFPDQPAAPRAHYLLADLDQDDGDMTGARAGFRRAIATGQATADVGNSFMRLAGLEYAAGQFGAARALFDEYRERYPRGRSATQAAFWSARASLELGDTARARTVLAGIRRAEPLSYYAGRAADLLNQEYGTPGTASEPPVDTVLRVQAVQAIRIADLLRAADRDDAATYEIGRVLRNTTRSTPDLYTLAELLNERGYTAQGIALGWDIYRSEDVWNPRLLRIVYPFPYRDLIVAEARTHGIDPFLAAALIRQESMFNARAVSPAGAIGLMQVMPGTGQTVARHLGVERFTADLLKEPELNVILGMQFLADMLGQYDQRVDAVLAAYNAGPSRVDNWREFPEWDQPELFTERVPFEETREYIKIVQQNARLYAILYGGRTISAADGPGM